MSSTNPPPLRRVSLPPLHEFRFELEPKEAIAITLLQGTAEVFGCELVPGQPHPFGDEVRAAVWTSEGAELEMSPFAEIDPHVPKGGEDRGGSVLYREVGNAFLLEGRSSVKATDRLEQLATSLCNVIPSLLPARWWRVKGGASPELIRVLSAPVRLRERDGCRVPQLDYFGAHELTCFLPHVAGRLETSYESSESPLPSYLSLHLALARLRLLARPSTFASNPNADLSLPDDEVPGPRMMLVGERGAGKTTLVKTLVNWRTREIWAKAGGRGGAANGGGVVVVNLDVGEGGCTMPGTMSLVSINSLLPTTTPVSSLGTATSSGPPVPFPAPTSSDWHPSSSIDAYAPPVNPLVFWHGHTSPNEHGPVYEQLLKRVGKALKRKLDEGGVEGWKAGCVVDTPGEWAEKKAMGNVSKAVRALESEFDFFPRLHSLPRRAAFASITRWILISSCPQSTLFSSSATSVSKDRFASCSRRTRR